MCVTAANSRVRGVAQWGISPACEKGGSQVTAVLTQKHIIHIKQKTANELISFSFLNILFSYHKTWVKLDYKMLERLIQGKSYVVDFVSQTFIMDISLAVIPLYIFSGLQVSGEFMWPCNIRMNSLTFDILLHHTLRSKISPPTMPVNLACIKL